MVCSARPMASVSRLRIAPAGARSSRKSTCDSLSRAGNEATRVPRGSGLTEFQMAHETHASVKIMHSSAALLAISGLCLGRLEGDAHLHPSGLEQSCTPGQSGAFVGKPLAVRR